MKALGYIRVSSEEQAISGLGLADQKEKIKLYCKMKGLTLGKIYEEKAVSGATPLAERKEGGRLLLEVEDNTAIVVLKLDRIFRNAGDCLGVIDSWNGYNISLHIIDFGGNSINAQTAAGKFCLTILAGAAEMERNITCERTKGALDQLRKNGYKTGGTVPYGYDVRGEGDTELVKNEAEQEVLKVLRELREAGETYQAISDLLNTQGIKTKTGKPWTRALVYGVMTSNFS